MSKDSTNNFYIYEDTITFGIDQSYLNFAIVVFKGDTVIDRVVFHAGEATPANLKKEYAFFCGNIIDQLKYIQNKFEEFVYMYKPKYLVFEGLSFGSFGDRVFQLGGLFFHITVSYLDKYNLHSDDCIITIPPKEAKGLARSYLPEIDQYVHDKNTGERVLLKSKKPKLNQMKEKKYMKKALEMTDDKWILDGYSTSGAKKESGAHDIPDAYFIGLSFINKYYNKNRRYIGY